MALQWSKSHLTCCNDLLNTRLNSKSFVFLYYIFIADLPIMVLNEHNYVESMLNTLTVQPSHTYCMDEIHV